MKVIFPKFFSVAKVYCNLFGHNIKITKSVTNHIHEYKCSHCSMEMTDTANGFIARMTPRFKETNNYLAQIHRRKVRKNFATAS